MTRIFFNYCPIELQDADFFRLLALVPDNQQKYVLKFKRRRDSQNSLIGRLLLRHAIHRMGFPILSFMSFSYNHNKKPILGAGPHFNISHSQFLTACAVSECGPIGIDVEAIEPIDYNAFKEQFNQYDFDLLSNGQDEAFFYSVWTKKEAILKAVGTGLIVPLNEVGITGEVGSVKGNQYYIREIKTVPGYACALATGEIDDHPTVHEIRTDLLCEP